MKEKKKFSPLWLIPAVVIIALILWCIHFPLTVFAGLEKDTEPISATVMVDQVPDVPSITFFTNDAEQLNEIVKHLCGVRGRFMGWFSMITYNDDPLLHLIVTGIRGNSPYHLSLCADSDGYVYIQEGNIRLRAKDSGLYDYLAELAESGEEVTVLNDGWNYTPDSNVVETVKSAILGEGEKDYCRSVVFHEAELDWDAREWAIKQYTDYKDGWTEEYLQENMMAVTASYTVDYDGRKTFLPSGRFERAFFLLWNSDIQKWELWQSTDMPFGEVPAFTNEAAEQTTGETAELLSSCNHTPGVYIKSEWKESEKFDPSVYCYYDVQWDYLRCADCSTPYSYETTEETFALHRKQVTYNENGAAEGFTCAECGYCG